MKSKLVLRQLLLPSAILLAVSSAQADNAAWNVDADGDWATGGSWDPAAAPGATSGTTNNSSVPDDDDDDAIVDAACSSRPNATQKPRLNSASTIAASDGRFMIALAMIALLLGLP